MEVTSSSDRVTHAVITQRAARAFTVSDSAEFITVLSDTLYSNKPLAVVREVLCNAWDIHIVTGRQDIPVKVTINDQEMVIQDFGTGIHDEDMDETYCGYGNSTKKNDGKQTGGFGLGSKAPYAYTDTFEVTSCHKGIKTIYRASKSVAEIGGKPGIIPIVSVPTEESGLTVKIPLKNPLDRFDFINLVKTVASNGEMNVELNGSILPVIPFSTAESNWMISRKENRYGSAVYVRYGNVIYPVNIHDQYKETYTSITKFLEMLPEGEELSITFMAQPNTISVTPSRESLSMAERTINTLAELFETFHFDFNKDMEAQCKQIVIANMIKQYSSGNIAQFFRADKLVMNGVSSYDRWERPKGLERNTYITNTSQIVNYYLRKNYPSYAGFFKFDFQARLDMLIANKFGDTQLIKDYKKFWLKTYMPRYKMSNVFFYKKIIWPLRKAGLDNPLVGKLKLQSLPSNSEGYYGGRGDKLIDVEKLKFMRSTDFLPYLRKIVVLTHRTTDFEDRTRHFKNVFDKLGSINNILVCTVPRAKGRPEAYRELFKAQGYEVIDLTIIHPWEEEETQAVKIELKARRAEPKKPEGLIKLGHLVDNNGYLYGRSEAWFGTDPRKKTIKPKAVIILTRNTCTLSQSELRFLKKYYGEVIGACVSKPQRDKYIKDGAVCINDFIESEFLHYLQNNLRVLSYLHYHPNWYGNIGAGDFSWIVEAARAYFPLAKSLGIVSYLNQKDHDWLNLWITYSHSLRFKSDTPRMKQIKAILSAPPVPPELTALLEKIKASKTIRFVDVREIRMSTAEPISSWTNYTTKLIGVRLLITALKG